MLQSVFKAVSIKGRRNSEIAALLSETSGTKRTAQTVTAWFSGRLPIPARIRAALCEAIGAPIDWEEYAAEIAALKAPADAPADAPAPAPAPPRPPAPRPVPKAAPTAPQRRLTATPPQKITTNPPPAPPMKPKGIFGAIFGPSDQDLFV